MNGSGGGDGDDQDDDKVLKFPSLAQRDRIRKAQKESERRARGQRAAQHASGAAGGSQPFFNPGKITPFARFYALSTVLVHLILNVFVSKPALWDLYQIFGFVPGYFTGAAEMPSLWAFLGPVTHMFIHGSWMHVFFNLIMGVAMSIFVERTYGTRLAVFLFAGSGLLGALAFLAFAPFAVFPLIGASGGISGLFGAVVILMSQQQAGHPLMRRGPWPLIAFWLGFMLLTGVMMGDNQAWQAHIGGFLGGVGLLHLIQKGKIRL